MKDFEVLPHTADIKIRVYGNTLDELFRHALIGMFQIIKPRASGCISKDGRIICNTLPEKRLIEVESIDLNALLVDFLSEALYLSDVYNEAYLEATIHKLTNLYVNATLQGMKIEGFEVVEIKAVTYHELDIKQVDDVWQTTIVFDI